MAITLAVFARIPAVEIICRIAGTTATSCLIFIAIVLEHIAVFARPIFVCGFLPCRKTYLLFVASVVFAVLPSCWHRQLTAL